MCEVLHHRGPDENGYFSDGSVGLGVTRLSIVDLLSGAQPIHNEDKSIWLVFNGEIYNYLELRKELEQLGHEFYTTSDTETIVHGYEEWSVKCVDHLRGMFGFALWDSTNHRLFLARDRLGKKPLYYATVDGVFLFASELKSILQFEGFKRKINFTALDHYFTYLYIPSPLTIFEGAQKLLPGHTLTLDRNGMRIEQYWDPTFGPDLNICEDELVELLYRNLLEAVKLRLRSDVPLGAFLSGGIDSSIVTSVMSQLLKDPIKTFTIGFNDPASELRYARIVADALGTDHHELIVHPESYSILPKLIWHFDEPFADPSFIPTFYLSQFARKYVKVALGGDGGDELFLGYPFFEDPPIYRFYSRVPQPARKFALKLVAGLPYHSPLVSMARHAHQSQYGEQPPDMRFILRIAVSSQQELTKLYSQELREQHHPTDTFTYMKNILNSSGTNSDFLDRLNYTIIKSFLREDNNTKVDRMSMAASLEVRSPLLDHILAEMVFKIPSKFKLKGRMSKYVLKKMVLGKNLVPPIIVKRKKQGFSPPIHKWLDADWRSLNSQIFDTIGSRCRLFDRNYLRKLLENTYANSPKIFSLTIFLIWYAMYIEKESTRSPKEGVYAYL